MLVWIDASSSCALGANYLLIAGTLTTSSPIPSSFCTCCPFASALMKAGVFIGLASLVAALLAGQKGLVAILSADRTWPLANLQQPSLLFCRSFDRITSWLEWSARQTYSNSCLLYSRYEYAVLNEPPNAFATAEAFAIFIPEVREVAANSSLG